jgi:hypothetical protein
MTSGRTTDFWDLKVNDSITVKDYAINSRTQLSELPSIAADTSVTIAQAYGKTPQLAIPTPSLDLADKKIKEIAEEFGIAASNERQAMLDKLLAHRVSQTHAKKLDGARVYFSFDGPIAIGRRLEGKELLSIAKFIKVKTAITESNKSIFEATIDPTLERADFQHYFKAKPRVWVVMIESLDLLSA